jgi:hypothetical protein
MTFIAAEALTPGCAPSILITFIGMVLFKYDTVALDGCENYMYPGQVRTHIAFGLNTNTVGIITFLYGR